MLHERTMATPGLNGTSQDARLPTRVWDGLAYRHILVPTSLAPRERPAIRLGLQLAAAHQAKVTFLHVVPPAPVTPSLHWLDAIDNLWDTLARPANVEQPADGIAALTTSRQKACVFLAQTVHLDLDHAPHVDVQCRQGDVSGEIARFADKGDVDLVILSWPANSRRQPDKAKRALQLLQLTPKQVVLVPHDTQDWLAPLKQSLFSSVQND